MVAEQPSIEVRANFIQTRLIATCPRGNSNRLINSISVRSQGDSTLIVSMLNYGVILNNGMGKHRGWINKALEFDLSNVEYEAK